MAGDSLHDAPGVHPAWRGFDAAPRFMMKVEGWQSAGGPRYLDSFCGNLTSRGVPEALSFKKGSRIQFTLKKYELVLLPFWGLSEAGRAGRAGSAAQTVITTPGYRRPLQQRLLRPQSARRDLAMVSGLRILTLKRQCLNVASPEHGLGGNARAMILMLFCSTVPPRTSHPYGRGLWA